MLEPQDKTMAAALKILNRRVLSAKHLREKLLERQPDAARVDAAIARLKELNLLNDDEYGQALIRELTRGKPAGGRLLRQKLSLKGLDRATVDRLIEQFEPDREQLAAFAEKQWRTIRETDERVKKRKLWSLLARRGFDSDLIGDVMEQLGDAE